MEDLTLKFLELLKTGGRGYRGVLLYSTSLDMGREENKKLIKADHIMVIFPWEVDFYKSMGRCYILWKSFVDKYIVEKRSEEYILLYQEVESRR